MMLALVSFSVVTKPERTATIGLAIAASFHIQYGAALSAHGVPRLKCYAAVQPVEPRSAWWNGTTEIRKICVDVKVLPGLAI